MFRDNLSSFDVDARVLTLPLQAANDMINADERISHRETI